MKNLNDEDLEEQACVIRHKLKFIEVKPSVACIDGLSPITIAGNDVSELVAIAGGKSIRVENGQQSPGINFEVIQSANPDVILIMLDGHSIQQTLQKIHLLTDFSGWKDLVAVKNNQVYIVDGCRYFNHADLHVVACVELLAEIMHPKQFVFGYEGSGWIKFVS